MNMKKILIATRLTLLAFLVLSTPTYASGTTSKTALNQSLSMTKFYDPSGTWNVEIDLPDRTAEGVIVISKNEKGEFEVSMEDTTENDTVELEEVSFDEEEMTLTGEVDVDGLLLKIVFEFDGDDIEGKISAEGVEMTLSGERETD